MSLFSAATIMQMYVMFSQVFVFRETLVLIAMHKFSTDDVTDSFTHLTNTCVSMGHADFKVRSCVVR